LKSNNIWKYINLGTGFRYLQEAEEGRSIHGDSVITGNIELFLNNIEAMGFKVTARATYKLKKLYDSFLEKDEKAKLSTKEAKELKEIINVLRPTFSAEARGIFTYVVTDKRLSTDKLIGEVNELFAPEIFNDLSDIAQYDFKEAGKCIVFERPTAAAFHLMRGVESVLKIYYKKYIRPAQTNLTWGEMTNPLKSKNRGKLPNKITLNQLDHIRKGFRNPTQHPEKIYDIHEAQDLFSLSVDVTNRMISEIHNKTS
jgi:hypothetical protein